jgi:hypothetical protein
MTIEFRVTKSSADYNILLLSTMAVFTSRILLLSYYCLCYANSFQSISVTSPPLTRKFSSSLGLSSAYSAEDAEIENILDCTTDKNAPEERLKRELFQLGASYDRGYGASSSAREKALSVIERLEQYNTEMNASRGIDGIDIGSSLEDTDMNVSSPLAGKWRMVWTTARDVLILEASPLFKTGSIYQVFDPPVVTNVIDFLPRIQSLLPLPSSVVRASVQTRATLRQGKPNRVGLVFERVQVAPMQIFGMAIDVFPPVGFDLPKLPGTEETDGPGFFDVTYLDDELLVIRQNAPGGIFVLVKVDSIDA